MKKSDFLLEDNDLNILKKAYIWNVLASLAAGSSSIILLMVARRFCGIEVGASFSVAVAIANLTINIGHFNMYGFQISDIKEEYSYYEYYIFRTCSIIVMMIVSSVFIVFRNYDYSKSILILLYCLYRGVFAFTDLIQGRYQQKNRADLSAKYCFFKIIIPDGIFVAAVIFFNNVELAIIMAVLLLVIYSFVFTTSNNPNLFSLKHNGKIKIYSLFLKCFPVFYYAIINSFVLNSSKYAIDSYLDDKARLYYAILLLPATTIHMILGFVYRPILTAFAVLWEQKRIKELNKRVAFLLLFAVVLLIGIVLVAKPIIIPILEILYDVPELPDYIVPFMILLIAGGMQAITTLYSYMLTIIRGQKHFLWIYSITLFIAIFLPNVLVRNYLFTGASVSYLVLSLMQVIMVVLAFYRKEWMIWNNVEM